MVCFSSINAGTSLQLILLNARTLGCLLARFIPCLSEHIGNGLNWLVGRAIVKYVDDPGYFLGGTLGIRQNYETYLSILVFHCHC